MSRDLYYVDTETVGLLGPAVLIQYGLFREPVTLHHVFSNPSRVTMGLIEKLMDRGVVYFNGVFDQYHLQKLYCMLDAAGRPNQLPTAERLAKVERRAVFGPCVKPRHILDLDVSLREGPYQAYMNRDPVVVYNVPNMVLEEVRQILSDRVPGVLDPFYYAGREEKGQFLVVDDVDRPGFHHLKLSFKPKLTLKRIHAHIFGSDNPSLPVPKDILPLDSQPKPGKSSKLNWSFMPYAEPVNYDGLQRERMWPEVLDKHVKFWAETPSTYAEDDITMLYDIDEHLEFPEADTHNHVLVGCVGSVRYRGFPFDRDRARARLKEAQATVVRVEEELGCSLDQHTVIRERLMEACVEELEATAITSSKDEVLQQLTTWNNGDHPVARIAKDIQDGRTAKKRRVLLTKLLIAGRAHPGFRVLGTTTDRMAGSDGLNYQGIDKAAEIRSLFTMVDTADGVAQYLQEYDPDSLRSAYVKRVMRDLVGNPWTLSGGDFDGFETAIAVAVWADPTLEAFVSRGEKAYMILGRLLYGSRITQRLKERYVVALKKRGLSHVQALKKAMKYQPSVAAWLKRPDFEDEKGRAKNCWYGWIYGAQSNKLSATSGLSPEDVEVAFKELYQELPGVAAARTAVQEALRCVCMDEGKWGWRDPVLELGNMLGYARSFEREVPVIKALWECTRYVPQEWDTLDVEIVRSDKRGPQKIGSAVRSAVFGAALSLQGRIQRQGSNFGMQSVGAQICKRCQVSVWGVQPAGVSPWRVQPMNVHDEIVAAHRRKFGDQCEAHLYSVVEAHRRYVPLIAITWKRDIPSWYEK